MPRKGEVRVSTSLANIREAVLWMHATRPIWSNSRVTLLGLDHSQVVLRKRDLQSLTARLQKAVKRQRRTSKTYLTVNVPRTEAMAFLSAYEGALVRSKLGGSKFWRNVQLQQDVKKALNGPGRKTLTKEQRAKRLSGAITVVPRQKKRVRKVEKDEVRYQAWSRDLRQRGQTLLTNTKGSPKI